MSQIPDPASIPVAPSARAPRRFSYLSAIIRSPYSAGLWRDVGQNWHGIGLLYMLLLLTITWLLVTIQTSRSFNSFLDREAPKLISQVPAIMITDGVVSIDKPEPYYIREVGSSQPVAVIDTTGELTAPPAPAKVLLTRNALIAQQSRGEMRTYDLSKVKSFHLDQTTINGWVSSIRSWFFVVMFVLVLIFGFIWRLILMLLGGAIGMLIASAFHARLNYAATMRLSAIAMTPGILLSTLISLTGLPSFGCFGFFLGIGLFVLFMVLTVKANAPEQAAYQPGFPVMPPPGGPPTSIP